MTNRTIEPEHLWERLEAMERKLDQLMQHMNALAQRLEANGLAKLEQGEDYPLNDVPEPRL